MAQAVSVETPERWAVLDQRGVPIPEVTPFLRHLASIERSTNTIRAYAFDLAHFYTFLEESSLAWSAITNEELAKFIAHMRTPDPSLATPNRTDGRRKPASVNRAMSAVTSFARYRHATANDPVYSVLLKAARVRKNRYSERAEYVATVGPRLRSPSAELKILDDNQVERIIDATSNLRDRFLFSLLDETGLRIGQALLLRHSDVRVPSSTIAVMKRPNEPGIDARNKSYNYAMIPVSASLIRLYAAYMHAEYRDLDSDFVFVNLWAGEYGRPLTYQSVEQTVARLQKKTSIYGWSAHTFRHTYVTRLIGKQVPIETISYLVTHSTVQTTLDTYNHLDVDKVRQQLIEAGAWDRD
ncbi:tyrosine-type recombinase/integrase [Protaetiibacter sp. SSC-01]|uniref:tyrosine-type recombinase/integrase n=1 Tax=Protaetiibacter sp. SSC-01 TaxID=2759943 RepID=UPI001656FBBF|nr:tyrosine-type recombinase/integrase [Protaetiibacter sp. SSC-01]QNO37961.1 tyrosine-type recombinase/integrase [Protaetiibacter sp. SSC-01]